MPFSGFPSRATYVGIPRVFFSDVLPFIEDQAEFHVSLQLFRLLGSRRGHPRAVSERELRADRALNASFSRTGRDPAREVSRGLDLAQARGSFLRAVDPEGDAWVLLNTAGDRKAAAAIERGRVPSPGSPGIRPEGGHFFQQPACDIFTLYEQTVATINPLIAERLKEAEEEYPHQWVEEAFGIAAEQNKRSWAYIEAILKRWKTEGKDDGKPGRHPKTGRLADYSTWFPARRAPG